MDPVQAKIENWRRKSAEVSSISHDVVAPVITKTFETMSAVMRNDADPVIAERALASLANERNLSMQYDNKRSDPIRDLTYDLVDAVHLILGQLNSSRNQSAIPAGYGTQVQHTPQSNSGGCGAKLELTPDSPLLNEMPFLSVEEPTKFEVDSFNDFDMNELFLKNELESIGDENETESSIQMIEQTVGAEEKQVSHDEAPLNGAKTRKRKTKEELNKSATVLRCVLCEVYGTYSIGAYMAHLMVKHQTNALEEGILFRCECGNEGYTFSHQRSNKCPNASVTIVRSDDTEERRWKRKALEERRESMKKARMEESSGKDTSGKEGNEKGEGAVDKSTKDEWHGNASTTVMECVKCDGFNTLNVQTYIIHLYRTHRMTPIQAGVSFKCACGNICRSNSHFRFGKCRNVSVTIVRDEDRKKKGTEMGREEKEEVEKDKSEKGKEDEETAMKDGNDGMEKEEQEETDGMDGEKEKEDDDNDKNDEKMDENTEKEMEMEEKKDKEKEEEDEKEDKKGEEPQHDHREEKVEEGNEMDKEEEDNMKKGL